MNIPLFQPHFGENELAAVSRVLESKKFSRGAETENFEQEFAKYVGKEYAVSLNSGTSGLHVLVRAFGWQEGDEVITTPFSYIASSNSLLFEKVTPVFVDIDPNTLNIDVSKIEEKISPRTKGILVVDILGLPVNPTPIRALAKKYNLKVIEDACEAVGRSSLEFPVGNSGDASVYGFHENKQLTTLGEGGMIATNDAELAARCRAMRDQGRSNSKNWIENVTLGFNFRMTEIQAAFGRAQLACMDDHLLRREEIAKEYSRLLSDMPTLKTPQELCAQLRSWFVYFVVLENEDVRRRIHEHLRLQGVQTSTIYFPPIYNFPMYRGLKNGLFPNTEKISKTLLVLPTYYTLSKEQIEYISNEIRQATKA